MTKAILYSMSNCPYCERAKRLLESRAVSTTVIDLTDKNDELATLSSKTGWLTLPQIWVNDKFIGGCDDLIKLDMTGKLS